MPTKKKPAAKSATPTTKKPVRVIHANKNVYHITCGGGDWIPTDAELDAYADLFSEGLGSNLAGAVIVTRDGVNICQIR